MKKYISPEIEIEMFETEDFIQTSGVTVQSLVKGVNTKTVEWADVKGGSDNEVDITAQ